MLAKLYCGDEATVSVWDLARLLLKVSGVQAGWNGKEQRNQFGLAWTALYQDPAAFCRVRYHQVQLQPAFQQQLLARMAEVQPNPQHITPHPPQVLAAMERYKARLAAMGYKQTNSPPADSVPLFLPAPATAVPIPEVPKQQHSTQPSVAPSIGHEALYDQQGIEHHTKEENVEVLKTDLDQRPTQARPCQGSPQSQPLESSKPVEFQEDVDTALYTVLQQHFWGDEHAAVKRVAAEAAMLAKLCGREVAAVSRRSLAKICNAAGVQCEHIGATLLTDTAAFTKNFSSLGKKLVQLQPSFEQLLLARMAEMQSNPQQITPHPPKLLAAMEAYKAIVAAGVAKSKRTNSSARPADSVPPSPPASATSSPIPEVSQQQHNTQPSAAPAIGLKALYDQQGMKHSSKEDNVEELKAHPDQRPTLARPCQGSPQSQPHESSISVEYEGKLDAALYTVLQQHFWGDEHAAVKRVAAEAAMLAKLYCGDDATVQTTDLDQIFKTAGVQAAKFGTTLFKDSAAFCRLGVTEVQLQPAFEQQLLAIMAELQSNPQHITPHPPQLLTAMEAYKAWLAERGSKGKQTNSPARPADSAPPPLPTSATPSPNPQVPAEQREHSTQPSAALSTGLKALLDQQGTKHHSEEDTVEMPKADLDQRPTRARPCQGSPQSQPQESSKSVEYKGELDTALYSVLQQHFLEDEHAAVKRVAAEAAMLAKLHGGGDTATVSTEDLDRIFKMAGVQAEQFDPALSKDSAAFCKLGSYVQVQPAFEQQLMAGMAELKSNPQHITPHPPHLLAAMKAYRVILGASSFKGERTNSSSPPADSIFSFLQAPPRTSPIPEIAQQQHSTQPSAAPSIGHEALLDQQGTKHHSKEDIVELLKADPDHRPQQAMPRPKESLVHAAKDVERPLTFAQRHRAEANHLARKLSLFQADTQQGSTDGGKPPPFIELQMKIGPGFSPSYLPYTKDAPSQVQPGTSSSIPSPSESTSASQDDGPEAGLDEEAASVISLLPSRLQDQIQQMLQGQESTFNLSSSTIGSTLTEIHIDEGRPVKLRFRDRPSELLPIKIPVAEALSHLVGLKERFHLAQGGMQQDPDSVGGLMGARRLFGSDGRMALPGMLHRVSGMRDSMGNVYALTYRVGRHQPGLAGIFSDLLAQMCARRGMQLAGMNSDSDHEVQGHGRGPSINSILIMGPPGCGKTTLLRDMARLLSTDLQQEVNVVDTSSEIAGHSFVPHPCIGNARRFLVPDRQQQHQILLEAVQNHGPEVVIVDEIGTEQEVAAVSTISQRGVKMVGTAHGLDLQSLIKNPVLVKLVGGIQNVTYGDETAKKRGSYKVSLARRGAPVFSTLIEVLTKDTWRVHTNVAESVDKALASGMNVPNTEVRRLSGSTCLVRFETPKAAQQASGNMED
ncbi:hypothetical protein DUNSADRAFT_10870 [Dunaliella salina]|uniref:AAA+ ATPase domain-containing protein n=1 Tax=Dunaliella salina TaxID=3046 RepID=A0ABQ7HA17_DUNSA|nr:hypothetical protein DUNSADRAFT_10870 [Dunaliella salina]|eukprot:KAF5843695.1 hypothetical protein DUNSADRAFT_10870 [Dunaliella salina]